jgi:hypothetical protein
MDHRTRWTPEKIKHRLELITLLVHINRKSLSSFRYVKAPVERCPSTTFAIPLLAPLRIKR